MIICKNLLAVFLVLALSGPTAVKLVHDLIHSHDEVCYEAVEMHFHQQQHECSICDFTLSKNFTAFAFYCDVDELEFTSETKEHRYFYRTLFYLGICSLRAPPMLV